MSEHSRRQDGRMWWSRWLPILILAATSLSALGACGGQSHPNLPPGVCRPAADDARPWEQGPRGLAIPPSAPRRGAERPRVVIQIFSDFECPFCAMAVSPMQRLLEDYGDCMTQVWRDNPMAYHAHANLAAQAAREAKRQGGDALFWRFHDRLFEAQEDLSRARLNALAEELELDLDAFAEALDQGTHAAAVGRGASDLGRIGLRVGTPSFLINGRLIEGAQPLSTFRREIEEAILEAAQGMEGPQP